MRVNVSRGRARCACVRVARACVRGLPGAGVVEAPQLLKIVELAPALAVLPDAVLNDYVWREERERGREGGREGVGEGGREGGSEGGSEGGRGREGGMEGERERERERGRERERESCGGGSKVRACV